MTARDEYFAPARERLNLELLRNQLVVIVGVGMVGSPVASALAQTAVGRLRFIDGDDLEVRNLHRHFLGTEYLGCNKALGMADVLKTVPALHVDPVPRHITAAMRDDAVDVLLQDADLIIAATDRRDVQRRIAQRARILDIPALFPGIYASGGGEVFLQRSWTSPCYMCWDAWRSQQEHLREDGVLSDQVLALAGLTTTLARSILDPNDEGAPLLDRPQDMQGLPQLYALTQFALGIKDVEWRPNCPSCGGGPASRPEPVPVLPNDLWPRPVPQPARPVARQRTLAAQPRPVREPSSLGALLIFGIGGLGAWCLAVYTVMAFLFGESAVESSSTYGTVTVALDVAPVPIALLIGLVNLFGQIRRDAP